MLCFFQVLRDSAIAQERAMVEAAKQHILVCNFIL
jgi:hypothetical protein